jgi:hypothetical protein
LKLREETLALQRAKLGPDHPLTLNSMNNLAASYLILGRHAEALQLHEETLELRKIKLGPDHPHTLWSMWSVAEALIALDRGAEAVEVIDECLMRADGKPVDSRLAPGVLDLRLRHFEKTGNAAGCRETAQMWEKLNRTSAGSLYIAACMRAVAATVQGNDPGNDPGAHAPRLAGAHAPRLAGADAPRLAGADASRLAKEDADRAMSWLTQAVAAGFTDRSKIEADKDLAYLRDRRDFQRLVSDLK